jgi:hypothetical protein
MYTTPPATTGLPNTSDPGWLSIVICHISAPSLRFRAATLGCPAPVPSLMLTGT